MEQLRDYLWRMEWTYSLPEINDMARVFWNNFPDYRIYAFHGDMAVGKTSFIRALCIEKKVNDSVSSPTFSIINEYSYEGGKLFHLDLYRVKDEKEAIRAGVEDCLYSGEICLVEWPDRAPGIFPDETLDVFFETLDEKTRKIKVPSLPQKNSG